MKIIKITLFFAFLAALLPACRADKYRSNRFAGIYEITKYTREHWDSTGKINETEFPCKYVFYLSANDNEFGNGAGKLDTSGVEPSFLNPLKLYDYPELGRFTLEWNLGTSDKDRLSFLKSDKDGITTNSVIVNVKYHKTGVVKSFTYFVRNPDGTYYFDEFLIKSRR